MIVVDGGEGVEVGVRECWRFMEFLSVFEFFWF